MGLGGAQEWALGSTPFSPTGYDRWMTADTSAATFDTGSILPPDPDGLAVLHEREYRVRSYQLDDEDGRACCSAAQCATRSPPGCTSRAIQTR